MTLLTPQEQKQQAGIIIRYLGLITEMALDKDDILPLGRAKQLVKLSPQVATMGGIIPEITAARIVQAMYHFGLIAVQANTSWAVYLFTNASGLRKIKNVLVRNPLYLATFYLAFYTRKLEGIDAVLFQPMGEIPAETLLKKLPTKIPLGFATVDSRLASNVARSILASQIDKEPIHSQISNVDAIKSKAPAPGRYILARDSFTYDDTEIQEHRAKVAALRQEARKQSKQQGKRKKKHLKAAERAATEKKQNGQTVCLSGCKKRVKTVSGCYCDSECGATTFWGTRMWCYVNPDECPKRAKHLQRGITGRAFDKCNPDQKTKTNKCWSGARWIDCDRV